MRHPLAALVLLAACSEASAPRDRRPQTDAATLAPDAAPKAFVDAAPQAFVDAAALQDAAVPATDTAAPDDEPPVMRATWRSAGLAGVP